MRYFGAGVLEIHAWFFHNCIFHILWEKKICNNNKNPLVILIRFFRELSQVPSCDLLKTAVEANSREKYPEAPYPRFLGKLLSTTSAAEQLSGEYRKSCPRRKLEHHLAREPRGPVQRRGKGPR